MTTVRPAGNPTSCGAVRSRWRRRTHLPSDTCPRPGGSPSRQTEGMAGCAIQGIADGFRCRQACRLTAGQLARGPVRVQVKSARIGPTMYSRWAPDVVLPKIREGPGPEPEHITLRTQAARRACAAWLPHGSSVPGAVCLVWSSTRRLDVCPPIPADPPRDQLCHRCCSNGGLIRPEPPRRSESQSALQPDPWPATILIDEDNTRAFESPSDVTEGLDQTGRSATPRFQPLNRAPTDTGLVRQLLGRPLKQRSSCANLLCRDHAARQDPRDNRSVDRALAMSYFIHRMEQNMQI